MGTSHWTNKGQARGCHVLKPSSDRARLIKQSEENQGIRAELDELRALVKGMAAPTEAENQPADSSAKAKGRTKKA